MLEYGFRLVVKGSPTCLHRSERKIRRASAPTCRFRIICPNEEMQKRADFIGLLDPRLTEEKVMAAI